MRSMVVGAALAALFASGCAYPDDPALTFRVDPVWRTVELIDAKDTDFSVERIEAQFDPPTLLVVGLEYRNAATAVREANAMQLQAFAPQAIAGFNSLNAAVEALPNMIRAVVPVVQAVREIDRSFAIENEFGRIETSERTSPPADETEPTDE